LQQCQGLPTAKGDKMGCVATTTIGKATLQAENLIITTTESFDIAEKYSRTSDACLNRENYSKYVANGNIIHIDDYAKPLEGLKARAYAISRKSASGKDITLFASLRNATLSKAQVYFMTVGATGKLNAPSAAYQSGGDVQCKYTYKKNQTGSIYLVVAVSSAAIAANPSGSYAISLDVDQYYV
jgi:hypothetical protein